MATTIDELLKAQDGVICRRQVLAAGEGDNFIEVRVHRKDWARMHTGVYVNHTGDPTWRQRAWAAVLFYWPAALSHQSALGIAGLRTTTSGPDQIHVAVDQARRVTQLPGVAVHRVTRLAAIVAPNRDPARIRLEHTLLGVASKAADEAAAVAVLADAVQTGRTTPARLADALVLHPCLPRRSLLRQLVGDVAEGTYSALEQRYLARVERPHHLPSGQRQRRVRSNGATTYRDVEYVAFATIVELDGRLGHEDSVDRWRDLERDIASLLAGDLTLRAGWGQVLEPCRLATTVSTILTARGWDGAPTPCGPSCAIGDSPASGAGGSPDRPGADRAQAQS